MSETSIRKAVKGFVLSNYLFTDDDSKLDDAESLVASGVIDSTGVVELITHLEETFGIKVAEEEMVPDNFESVDRIVAFIESKRASR